MNAPTQQVRERLRTAESALSMQRRQIDALRDRLREVSVTGANQDGSVTVTVDANGTLVDLRLSESAMRYTPRQLQAEILAGVQATTRQLPDAIAEAAERTLGSGHGGPMADALRRMLKAAQGVRHDG